MNPLYLYTNQSPLLYVSFVLKWVTHKSSERPPLLDWIRESKTAYLLGDKRMLRKLSFSHAMGFRAGSYSLPIHLHDMAALEERHLALYVEFQRCHFMGLKSWRAFSNIPCDQMHEQRIDWLKNHTGVIESLDDPSTVCGEQVVRPELAGLVI